MDMQIDKWLAHCTRYCTKRTIDLYRSLLHQFETYLSNDGNQLTTEAIDVYIDDRLAAGWSKRYANCNLTAIKSYCRWRSERFKEANPAKTIRLLKEDPPKQRVLAEEEYQKVMAIAFGQERDIIAFLANTGLRVSEFNSLTWDQIDLNSRVLSVVGKGQKVRVIPLNQVCLDILSVYAKQGMTGKLPFARKDRHSISLICGRLANRVGITHFSAHSLRHYFATRLMRKGVSLYKISKILGHSSVSTTEQIYVHFVHQDVLGVTDCLDS